MSRTLIRPLIGTPIRPTYVPSFLRKTEKPVSFRNRRDKGFEDEEAEEEEPRREAKRPREDPSFGSFKTEQKDDEKEEYVQIIIGGVVERVLVGDKTLREVVRDIKEKLK